MVRVRQHWSALRKGCSVEEAFEIAGKHAREWGAFYLTRWAAGGEGRRIFKAFAELSSATLKLVEDSDGGRSPYVLELEEEKTGTNVKLEVEEKDLRRFDKLLSDAVYTHLLKEKVDEFARENPSYEELASRVRALKTYVLNAYEAEAGMERKVTCLKRKLETRDEELRTHYSQLSEMDALVQSQREKICALEEDAERRRISHTDLEEKLNRIRDTVLKPASYVDLTQEEDEEDEHSPDPDSRCYVCLEEVDMDSDFAVLCDNVNHRLHRPCCSWFLSFAGAETGDGLHTLPRQVRCGYCRQRRQGDPFSPLPGA
jgi:hypothetical protein